MAVCTTLSGSPAVLASVRLFTCSDTAPDKCTGSVQLNVCTGGATCKVNADCPIGQTCAQQFDTACEVSQQPSDPFPTGDSYPFDSVAVCALDLDEFGPSGQNARLIDACSYPSTVPNSDPSDCVLYRQCTTSSQCNDDNACTIDTCQGTFCVHTPDVGASCDDGDICTITTTCDSQGFCTDGVAAPCDDGDPCTIDTCALPAGCSYAPAPNGTLCDDGAYCTTGDTCTFGVCGGSPRSCGDGIPCTADSCNETTDQCVHAPNSAICDNGQYCDGNEVCNPSIGCQPGTPVVCSDGFACTLDSCNEITDECDHAPDNALCTDHQFCNGVETCDVLAGCLAGTPVNCNDGISCTVDACDEVVDQCTHSADHPSCNNGLFCDGAEVCNPAAGCQAGPPIDCGDGVGCTMDSCDEAIDQCVHAPNSAACDNGAFCDGAETCHAVNDCQPGTPPACSDGISCTADDCDEDLDECVHAPNDAVCNDSLYCNGTETCNPSTGCVTGAVVDCNDGVSCTVDACNEASDSCDHTPNPAVCLNSLFCDGTETCDPVLDCRPGSDPCAPLSCNENLDQCVTCLIDAQCDNGQFCDGAETCNVGTGMCVPGTPLVCDDGIGCTADSCNETTDACVNAPNNTLCANGLYCDGVEVCNPATGCEPGTPVVCVDTVDCTVDFCNEAQDRCNFVPDNAPCSDGQFCNGVEVCSLTLGCRAGTPRTCGDGVACTLDSCDEVNDVCVNAANHAYCSDGQYCNGAEICNPVANCQPGTPVVCADAFACTADSCDEFTDACQFTPNHALCTNGLYCDGQEICSPAFGCTPNVPIDCSDNNACTVNSCSEAEDECVALDICCGNGSVDPGEECEYSGETCSNMIDDDADALVDCADPDCNVPNCTTECTLAPPCSCIERDPSILSLRKTPNFFKLHGRIPGNYLTIDPQEDGVAIQIRNIDGTIYEASLPPGSFIVRSAGRLKYKDKSAKTGVDPIGTHAGLAQFSTRFRNIDGVEYFTFKIKAYGDFSVATLPCMTTQVTIGTTNASLSANWTLRKAGAWWLRPGDYECPTNCNDDLP